MATATATLAIETHERSPTRIAAGPLHRWLAAATAADRQRPPDQAALRHSGEHAAADLRRVRQSGRRAPPSYLRYLTNSLRTTFELPGVPLRLRLRTGKNPYV